MKGLFQKSLRKEAAHAGPFKGRSVSSKAFTLMELLVVIAIIAVLTSVGAVFLRDPKAAVEVPAGVAVSSSVFEAARTLAQTRNTKVMVLVNDDETDLKNYRRLLLTVFWDTSDADEAKWKWSYESKPVQLPSNVFFYSDPDKGSKGVIVSSTGTLTTTPLKTLQIQYPGDLSIDTGPKWLQYQFAPNGVLEEDRPNPASPGDLLTVTEMSFVLVGGRMNGTGVVAEKAYDTGGFIVREMGGLTFFRDPEQITEWPTK